LAELIYVILNKNEEYQEDEDINKLYNRKIKVLMSIGNNKGTEELKKDIKSLIKAIRIT
jgi:50S ribosomal subunit-associated GTPase HflX